MTKTELIKLIDERIQKALSQTESYTNVNESSTEEKSQPEKFIEGSIKNSAIADILAETYKDMKRPSQSTQVHQPGQKLTVENMVSTMKPNGEFHGVDPNRIPDFLGKALTRNYGDLMKEMNKPKNGPL